MSYLRLFPLVVSAAAIARAFAAPLASRATSCARRSRRVVATGLAVAMLIPLVPRGHLHADTVSHDEDRAALVEVEEGAGARTLRCPLYISSQSWMRPDRGHLTFEVCVPINLSFGPIELVSCTICVCDYEMESGRMLVSISMSDCSGGVTITNPNPVDGCGSYC